MLNLRSRRQPQPHRGQPRPQRPPRGHRGGSGGRRGRRRVFVRAVVLCVSFI